MSKAPYLVLVVSAVPCPAIALWVGANAWDDGAITLAYSRTWADFGRYSVTPVSEVAEGYSSTAWMLLNGVVRMLVDLDFSLVEQVFAVAAPPRRPITLRLRLR